MGQHRSCLQHGVAGLGGAWGQGSTHNCPIFPCPGSPCSPRSGGHSPRGAMSQEEEPGPGRVPPPEHLLQCGDRKGHLSLSHAQESPLNQAARVPLILRTHHCRAGFCPYLRNLKLFPKFILIIKLLFSLNRAKEAWLLGHCRLPARCHQPAGSPGAVPSSAERGVG